MSCDVTIVTACDSKFVWGATLLGLSLRYHGMSCPYNILGYDLSKQEVEILQGIPNTKVFLTHKSDNRSVCTQKPWAIATAITNDIVWMDADCIVSGNIESLLICPEGKLQIRHRGKEENASVFRNIYKKEDAVGEIPLEVLDRWRKDVNDLNKSRLTYMCQTNCFVLNRNHLDFISLWQQQMEKVIPLDTKGVYAKESKAYFMTDESVINSLFAFSSKAPETSEYLMDKSLDSACIHFGLNPKPWQHWTKQAYAYYDDIQALLNWARVQQIKLPALTESLKPENRDKEYRRAKLLGIIRELRYWVSSHIRRALRKVK
ncbi:MAG: hypothetical protein PHO32_10495 [Candidatus Cloacimonetes bacterium]|nr:hypothetical protein [Candidatus Cloacimonadota bacterium]